MASRWNNNGRPYQYYYDDRYYADYGSTAASGPSSYRDPYPPRGETERGKDHRKRPADDASSSVTPAIRPSTPPRKAARQGSPERRRGSAVARPDLRVLVQRISDNMSAMVEAKRTLWDAENSNAKFDRFRNRGDISKENKAKMEKAAEEVELLRQKEKSAIESTTQRLSSLADEIVSHVESSVAAAMESIETTREAPGAPRPVTPTAVATPEDRPAVGTSKGRERVESDGVTQHAADKDSRDKARSFSAKKRLQDLEILAGDVKMETEDRLNQFESLIGELVQDEVKRHVQAARERKARRTEAGGGEKEEGAAAEPPVSSQSNGREARLTVPQVRGSAETGDMEEGEIMSSQPPVAPAPLPGAPPAVAKPVGEARESSSKSEDGEPSVSREQVHSLMQSLRQEFDTKLHAQDIHHRLEMAEMRQSVEAKVKAFSDHLTESLAKHLEVLSNHRDILQRHDQLWQGTLGIFNNIPKPQQQPQ